MALIRLDMTMPSTATSRDPTTSDAPMGVDGFRLFNWLDLRDEPGPSGQVYAEAMATRALISGRRTYELAGHWGGDHHDGVPIFVLTHHVPTSLRPALSASPPTSAHALRTLVRLRTRRAET